MFSASTSIISKLQLSALLLVAAGFFVVDFSVGYILLSIFMFYIFNTIGVSITLHRYYSHKNFEFKNVFLKNLFTFVSIILCRGSPIGWVYIHRLHHAYSDTDKDPHSPENLGFKLFGLGHIENHNFKINKFIIKDLMNKEQLNINKYYLLFIILYILILALIDISLIYFLWALPVAMVHISQNSFNYFGHKFGYRNFETSDNSTNNIFLFPFVLGDAWHNNHHKNPANYSTKIKWWEIDLAGVIISLVKK
jgi:stearoyl-CoA desaturase (delta-9 desaturase)